MVTVLLMVKEITTPMDKRSKNQNKTQSDCALFAKIISKLPKNFPNIWDISAVSVEEYNRAHNIATGWENFNSDERTESRG